MRAPLALAVVLLAPPAAAGPVSELARGVENKQETHEEEEASEVRDHRDEPTYDDSDDDGATCFGCGATVQVSGSATAGTVTSRGIQLEGPTELDVYLGAHAVVGSQGALATELRLHRDFIGLSLGSVSYFEHIEDKGRMDDVRMDMWTASLGTRLVRTAATELWIEAGLAATTSTEYDAIFGSQVSLRAEHRLLSQLALVGRVRGMALQHELWATDGYAGVQAGWLAVGYRALKFNIGPALHGPEAGIAIAF